MAMRKPITSATMRRSMTGARSRAEGAGFESLINSACEYYRTNGIADIEKTPEPHNASWRCGLCPLLFWSKRLLQGSVAGLVRYEKSVRQEVRHAG